jgi:hypothetical protein
MTTRWRRASSPRSNASCSIGVASRSRPRRASPSSSSSKASTIRAEDTRRSGTCPPSSSSANSPRRSLHPRHTSMPSCSRPSRSGLEMSQYAAPPARRPSLTAARHDSRGNVQAGTKRCSRPNQKMASKRRTECPQPRYPHPKTSPLHETGASPECARVRRSDGCPKPSCDKFVSLAPNQLGPMETLLHCSHNVPKSRRDQHNAPDQPLG